VINTGVVVSETPISITGSTEIVGGGSGVKALDASEIESHKVGSAGLAPHTGFHDVVQREDFVEIQATVPVTVQATERVEVNTVVATLPEERHELIEAN
jgi:hypothetical protein